MVTTWLVRFVVTSALVMFTTCGNAIYGFTPMSVASLATPVPRVPDDSSCPAYVVGEDPPTHDGAGAPLRLFAPAHVPLVHQL
jgi:hypothetical protein